MKSMAFDTQSAAFDTKSKTKLQKIDKKSIAFDKKSIAIDWKSSGNCKQTMRNLYKINSIRQESSSIRYEIGKLQKIDKKSTGNR